MRTTFCEAILREDDSQNLGCFPRAGRVWEGMRAEFLLEGAKNSETTQSKLSRSFLLLCGCPSLKGMHPRHPPRAFPLWLLAPRCLCAGKQIVKRLKYQKMSRLLDCPLFLGRGSFLSPGRAIYSESTRSTPSPSPLYALYIYVRGVAFATRLCDFV